MIWVFKKITKISIKLHSDVCYSPIN